MTADRFKSRADAWIADNRPRWSDWCATIWDFAETSWREYRSKRSGSVRSRAASVRSLLFFRNISISLWPCPLPLSIISSRFLSRAIGPANPSRHGRGRDSIGAADRMPEYPLDQV